jgi:hypothetical protein
VTNDSDWLTVKEAATQSGYHPEYIRYLIRSGLIMARKVITVWLVDSKSFRAYLDSAQDSKDGRHKPRGNKS